MSENVILGNDKGSFVFAIDGIYNYDALVANSKEPSQFTSLYVPPNKTVRLSQAKIYTDANSIYYVPGTYGNLNFPNIGVGAGQIRSFSIHTEIPWTDFKLACCRGETSDYVDSTSCGKFWKTAGTGDCDVPITSYCKENAWDTDVCSCVNSKVAGIAPCIDPNCTNSGAYLTSNQRKVLNEGCPDRTICTQNVIVGNDAYANLINLKLTQTCGASNPTVVENSTINWRIILIIFIICIIFATIIIYNDGSNLNTSPLYGMLSN